MMGSFKRTAARTMLGVTVVVVLAVVSAVSGMLPWLEQATATLMAAGTTNIAVQPAAMTVGKNQQFTVDVAIQGATDLGSFEFVLHYDPAVLNARSVTIGPFAGSTGRSVAALPPTINNSAGSVSYGAYSIGATPAGPNGDGVIATITFDAVAAGGTALTLSDVVCTDVIAVSEPIGLLGGGQVVVVAPATATPLPTNTPMPPTPTSTALPPSATATKTPVPPTGTATNTAVPATNTATKTALPATTTPTKTALPATSTPTNTAAAATGTPTSAASATAVSATATATVTNEPRTKGSSKGSSKGKGKATPTPMPY